jgi:hypothetical protein
MEEWKARKGSPLHHTFNCGETLAGPDIYMQLRLWNCVDRL